MAVMLNCHGLNVLNQPESALLLLLDYDYIT